MDGFVSAPPVDPIESSNKPWEYPYNLNLFLFKFKLLLVGEFRKTRHPRNVDFNKVLKTCFSGAGNSRFSEACSL
jgi:hypothetical protein